MSKQAHISVLGDEAVAALAIEYSEVHVDGTFGLGGYTALMLAQGARVIAFDRDPTAIAAGKTRFADAGDRLSLIEAPFDQMAAEMAPFGIASIDGAVFDFGVSSMQIDQAARGFSFQADGPLDMRMGAGRTVAEFVNTAEEEDLANVIYQYGEERRSRHLARLIVAARTESALETTAQLAQIAEKALGRGGKIHPATRLFQALRIFINDELGQIVRTLIEAEHLLRAGGRLVAVSFHSLEDRIVKRFLAQTSGKSGGGSRHEPQISGPAPTFTSVAKAVVASSTEIAANPRARSARLRAAVRNDTVITPWTDERLASLGVPPMVFSPLQHSWK